MAKQREEQRPTKSKMTVMVFQLEGNDETIQEGLRRVSEAVHGMVRPTAKLLTKSADVATSGTNESQEASVDDTQDVSSDTTPGSTESEDSGRPSKRDRSEKPVQYLSAIESSFKNATVSIEDFVKAKKSGEGATRRTLVTAMWLRDHGGIDEFTADHIYTCFKWMKWTNTPDHPRQFLRNLKAREHCFDGGTKPAHFKLNHRGEKLIEEEVSEK